MPILLIKNPANQLDSLSHISIYIVIYRGFVHSRYLAGFLPSVNRLRLHPWVKSWRPLRGPPVTAPRASLLWTSEAAWDFIAGTLKRKNIKFIACSSLVQLKDHEKNVHSLEATCEGYQLQSQKSVQFWRFVAARGRSLVFFGTHREKHNMKTKRYNGEKYRK